jgi:hypothetical protein
MNNLTKKGAIKLDENYSLESDGGNGISLVFSELRKRLNKKTDIEEDFTFIDRWYFLTAGQAIENYVKLRQNGSKTLDEVVENTRIILKMVEEFKVNYINW